MAVAHQATSILKVGRTTSVQTSRRKPQGEPAGSGANDYAKMIESGERREV